MKHSPILALIMIPHKTQHVMCQLRDAHICTKLMVYVCCFLLLAGGAKASPAPESVSDSARGGAPAGYDVAITSDFGKKLVTHKANVRSVEAALVGTLLDMSQWFDSQPVARGAFLDAKDRRRGGVPFTAQLRGQPVQGLVFCTLEENGADLTVAYCRADGLASDWFKLTGNPSMTKDSAAANVRMIEYAFPDGTGSIQLPEGWKTKDQTCIHGVHIEGPGGQLIMIGQSYMINTPDSFIVQNQMRLTAQSRQMGMRPPPSLEMLVAPYNGPVDALVNLVPQFSQMSQRRGGPKIILNNFLEKAKPAQSVFPNGQAASVHYALTRTTSGVPMHYHCLARIDTCVIGKGAWSMCCTELAAPADSFDKDLPTMIAIVNSQKENHQAIQQATSRTIANQNKSMATWQQIQNSHQKAFDSYLKSVQHNQLIFNRSTDDFDEIIRGTREVKNTQTGESGTVSLYNSRDIAEKLNTQGGSWVEVPLRDKMDPLPVQSDR